MKKKKRGGGGKEKSVCTYAPLILSLFWNDMNGLGG